MKADIAIVGAGIAGASLAAELAPHARVLLLEAEDQPGRHATGRSAAFWSETYGGPGVQPLTSASHALLAAPPADFADRPFLSPRGELHIADDAGLARLDALEASFAGTSVDLRRLDRAALEATLPGLAPAYRAGLLEPSCQDIDVAALHAAYLGAARRHGAGLVCGAELLAGGRSGAGWRLETAAGEVHAGIVVDAAGAWADTVAARVGVAPLGIRPFRRTVAQVTTLTPPPPGLPLVMDACGAFYMKPEGAGRLWLSPHDETPCDPCDAAAEEIDVATAIDRFERALDWQVARVERRWAGLRSFAPDRLPVYGMEPAAPGFFWFAGQGGFGIQTAPAAAMLAAALVTGHPPAPAVAGIDPAAYAPSRLR